MRIRIRSSANRIPQSEAAFILLFLFFWSRHNTLNWVLLALSRFPIVGGFVEIGFTILTVILALLAFGYIKRFLRIGDIVFLFVFILSVIASQMYPTNEYLSQGLNILIWSAFPCYFLGLGIEANASMNVFGNKVGLEKVLFYLSLSDVVLTFAAQFYAQSSGSYNAVFENSGFATYTMIPLCYLVYYLFAHRSLVSLIGTAIGVVAMVSYANRTALLAIVIMFAVMTLVFINQSKYKYIAAVLIIIFGFLFFLNFDFILLTIETALSRWGFNTRIIRAFHTQNLNDLNGRDIVYQTALTKIKEEPFIGYGIFGDRMIYHDFNGYAHNLFLELLLNFGVIIGGLFSVIILYRLIKAVRYSLGNTSQLGILLSIGISQVTMLMFGGSYLVEGFFFMLLGYATIICRQTNRRTQNAE